MKYYINSRKGTSLHKPKTSKWSYLEEQTNAYSCPKVRTLSKLPSYHINVKTLYRNKYAIFINGVFTNLNRTSKYLKWFKFTDTISEYSGCGR